MTKIIPSKHTCLLHLCLSLTSVPLSKILFPKGVSDVCVWPSPFLSCPFIHATGRFGAKTETQGVKVIKYSPSQWIHGLGLDHWSVVWAIIGHMLSVHAELLSMMQCLSSYNQRACDESLDHRKNHKTNKDHRDNVTIFCFKPWLAPSLYRDKNGEREIDLLQMTK